MGSLAEESGNFPLAGGSVTGVTEVGKRLGSLDESIVGVEAFGRAGSVITMLEHLVEVVPRDDAPKVTHSSCSSCSSYSSGALALASSTAVIRC